jgi:DNA-binding transcriptional ArsR family regulator
LHRTRMQMLQALGEGPATCTQVAERLDVHPANLTRHWRVLIEAGLVVLAEKRDTGRNLEKYYAATAKSFDVAPGADALVAPHKIALAFARSELSAALARLPDAAPGPVAVRVVEARLSPGRITAYLAAAEKLAAQFEAESSEEGEPFTLVVAMYPGDAHARPRQRIHLKGKRRHG